jgi:hypothetical protein
LCGRSVLLAGPLLIVAFTAGCRVTLMRSGPQPAVPTDQNAELMEFIGDQPYVTAEAAYRAVYILWKGADAMFRGSYEELQSELEQARIIDPLWKLPPDAPVDRASVGYMIARVCNIRTGLNWQLLGLGRYAYREVAYRGIAEPAGDLGLVSGGEFLGILLRAEQYMQTTGKGLGPRPEIGPEPGR